MDGKYNLEARNEYARALKAGQREYSAHTARSERGILPSLDELTNQSRIVAYMKQPQREISLSRVVGTYTSARANSFAPNYMPLHQESSEFAAKWINLCAIHMEEGLRDAVQVYEYLWNYYVIEGNKRVSILKHFESPAIRADITRVVPQLDDRDPDTAVYYAYLHYDKKGLFKNIRLSSQAKYEQLTALEIRFNETIENLSSLNFNSMYLQFEAAYAKVDSPLQLGDAFFEYMKLYGLPVEVTMSEIIEQLNAMLPQLILASKPPAEPTLVLTPQEKPPAPGLITRLFGQRRNAKVVFAYPAGRTEDNWIGAHELGRQHMQEELGKQVLSTYIDGLSAHNMYEELSSQATDADLLLITSSQLALPSLRFSLEHPECLTLIYSRLREDFRLSTYYGRYYEAIFLCGMAAGMATKAMKVAYITPQLDYKRHTADINAFALGVKAVREDAEVLLVWKDVLPLQPTTSVHGLKAAAQEGADVAYTPRYTGLKDIKLPEGVFSFIGRIDENGNPIEYLAAPQWDWGRFYTEIVSNFLNGSLDILSIIDRGDPSVTGLWWGLGAGVLRFLVSDTLGMNNAQLLHFMRASIARDNFNPFYGPIVDKEGKLRVQQETSLRPYEVLNMEWLCDFIQVIG
ncbi:MAG: BMP family ABC transporter substrate-binding protein [Clostridiales bacterium]|nr:BMP family ABC transporter substrate-binding protein [Clostridiales bacterium]